jgi:TonB-linked SusC/RagA family outer membrane protein
MQAHASGFGQKISLQARNRPLEKVLADIRDQSGFTFVFTESVIRKARPVTASLQEASLEEALRQCLDAQAFNYSIVNKVVVIKSRETPPPRDAIAAAAPPEIQNREVRGTVTDSLGQKLPGVSVVVKGKTTIGTQTDENGRFILDVPEGATLLFTMVGFEQQEVMLGSQATLNIVLKDRVSKLDETVIVAFGTQKRTDMVGSVVSVNPSDLKVPSSNLTTALAGKVAGVIAYQRSGEPGQDNADFFVRGVTTFGYKRDPLILIDGVELTVTDLARMQTDDIASFSIMKDATATALYGARGANGVIAVTTKKGKEGTAKISLRVENSISEPTRNVELADPVTYMEMYNESVLTRNPLNSQNLPLYAEEKIAGTREGLNPVLYPATDWRRSLMKDRTSNQRANMNVSGGGKVARYYVAGSFTQDNGMLKVDRRNNFNNNINLKSYTLRANVNVDLTRSTELVVRLNGNFDEYNGPLDGGTEMYRKIMRSNPVRFPAYYPADDEHKYVKHIMFGNYEQGNYINPYADMVKGYKDYSRSLMLAQLELHQKLNFITEGLTWRTMMNTNRTAFFDVTRAYTPFFYDLSYYDKQTGEYDLRIINEDTGTEYLDYRPGKRTLSTLFYLESALNYNRTFGGRHNLSGMLVYIMRESLNAEAEDLQQSLPYRNVGLSGRATYAYDSRYFLEFNFGYNGSERFYKSQRFGFFPSAGLAWSVSNEKFFEPYRNTVSNLRLRATYGLVGNDAIGGPEDRFFYLSNVNMNDGGRSATFGRDFGTTKNGISILRYSNTAITWERARTTNVAVELGLFDRVNLTAEYFRQNRDNILMTRPQLSQVGYSADVRANVGAAEANGVDITANYQRSFAKGLWLSVQGNFTYSTSKFIIYDEPDYPERWRSKIGRNLSQQWGYIAEHLFVDDKEVANSPRQNFGEYGAGDIKYRDVNGDGQITEKDQVPIGFPTTPEIVYGAGFSVGYKNFDLSAFFQGLGREAFWIDAAASAPFANGNQVLKAYADSYWSEANQDSYALWPRLSATPNGNNTVRSTWFMRNGAFLRLKNVEVGYTMPSELSRRFHIQKLRVYLSGTNLMNWSDFKLWDVEMGGNGLGYPLQRVFNVGLNVSF